MFSGCASAQPLPDNAVDDPAAYAVALQAETNRVRADRGLARLTVSECAIAEARLRAAALVGAAELEHAPLTGVIDACDPPSGLAAENLSRADAPPQQVVEAWLASPGHANNLLSPQLSQFGIGCVIDEAAAQGGMLCSQVFLG